MHAIHVCMCVQEFDVEPSRTVREEFLSVYKQQQKVVEEQERLSRELEQCGEDMERMQVGRVGCACWGRHACHLVDKDSQHACTCKVGSTRVSGLSMPRLHWLSTIKLPVRQLSLRLNAIVPNTQDQWPLPCCCHAALPIPTP